MNRQRALTLVCAVCCCVALVTLSSSLDAAVSGSPEDEFDVGVASLPVSSDDAGELRDAYESASGTSNAPANADRESGDATGESNSDAGDRSDDERAAENRDGGSSSRARSGQADEFGGSGRDRSQAASGQGTGTTAGDQQRDWLAVLRRLLRAILRLGVAAAVVAAVWLTIRHRDRLLGWLGGGRSDPEPDSGDDATPDHPFDPPANEVERSWTRLAERADVAFEPGTTPRECADRLVQTGCDREAVAELTGLFERVRYGSALATSERVQRARESLQRAVPSTEGGEGR